jgi:hypothetical protein
MAYYNQNSNPATNAQGMNEKKDEEQQQGANAPVQLSNGSAPAAPMTMQAQPQANANVTKPASSGMGAGFQAYTKANQGKATNNLAQAAQSNVQNLGQQAQTSINQATNKFGQKVDAGSLANRQQAVQDVAAAVQAARQTTVPAPQAQNGVVPPAAQPQANQFGNVNQDQANRFKEVINAKYQGPESLRQSGLYAPAQQNVQAANQAAQNSQTAQGREELLRQMYEKRGDYNRGLNKLDTSLLNSSKQGVANLQQTAGQFKNINNDLNKAQMNSGALAQNRASEIQNIQNQARNTFTQGKQAEEAATDQRLASVIKDWDKLPEHFREIIRKSPQGQIGLNQAEAGILGILNGEGLYKLVKQLCPNLQD